MKMSIKRRDSNTVLGAWLDRELCIYADDTIHVTGVVDNVAFHCTCMSFCI